MAEFPTTHVEPRDPKQAAIRSTGDTATNSDEGGGLPVFPKSLDEARAMARDRFKQRLENGDKVGGCDCHTAEAGSAPVAFAPTEPSAQVVGVRFRDSGRTYYFRATGPTLETGNWVVVETARGREAGRVIIAPHQVRLNQLQGDLKPVLRRMTDDDVAHMEALKRDSAVAVKTFGRMIREHRLAMKPITAEYSFDGAHLTLNYSAQDRVEPRNLAIDLANHFNCRVELKQVGPRDEARLLGGMGRCGRTLCCSSWLPVFPEISMGMAKTQDLSLNPTKVSGVCGRLLCCLSYENEQYKQMKAVLPRLGQMIETPQGPGLVVSLQVLKELVTVRLQSPGPNQEMVFSSADLGFGKSPEPATVPAPVPAPVVQASTEAPEMSVPTAISEAPGLVTTDTEQEPAADIDSPAEESSAGSSSSRRRRRRRRGSSNRADGGGPTS